MPYGNFTLDELARRIGMDAREVRRWVEKGRLPGQMVNGQWRFNRAALLDFLQHEIHTLGEQDIRNLERAMSDGSEALLVTSMLAGEGVELNLSARTKTSVLRELVAVAERSGLIYDAPALIEALGQRESRSSTGLPGGFAFPHPIRPMPYATAEPLVCIGRVPAGVPFGALDRKLTDLFVLVCSHDDQQHLLVLARLAIMFSGGLGEEIRDCQSSEEALARLTEAERLVVATRCV
ncbi:PTS system fructose-specific EIIABC component [Phycisphaerae bacterium RAS1]|nr:PTS system fructose-specific EIIABC component [Phycisphaerae bacterium RAS1]